MELVVMYLFCGGTSGSGCKKAVHWIPTEWCPTKCLQPCTASIHISQYVWVFTTNVFVGVHFRVFFDHDDKDETKISDMAGDGIGPDSGLI